MCTQLTHDTCTRITMVGALLVIEGSAAAVAGTVERGAVDVKFDKHALTSAASQLWPRCCWHTASTTSIGTLLARKTLTRLTVVGDPTILEGGATAVAAPVALSVYKFVKKHPAMYCPCTAPVTVAATPRARPPREVQAPPRAWHTVGLKWLRMTDASRALISGRAHSHTHIHTGTTQHMPHHLQATPCTCKCTCHTLHLPPQCPSP